MPKGGEIAHGGREQRQLQNFTIDGKKQGGQPGPDNAKAMFRPGNRWTLADFIVKDGRGVNVGFDGADCRIYRGGSLRGGSSGFGGKHDRAIFVDCWTEGCDWDKQSDGAAWGKCTQTNATLYVRCSARNGWNAGFWGDINNSNLVYIDCLVDGLDFISSSKDWTAVGFKARSRGTRGGDGGDRRAVP
jgi:hypothetical protein